MKVLLFSMDGGVSHGTRSISSYLKNNGHETTCVFSSFFNRCYLFTDECLQEVLSLAKQNYDIIGFSTLGYNFERTKQIIDVLKQLKKPIIIGGMYATTAPEDCQKYADYVCIGEGEGAILQLIRNIRDKKDTSKILNIYPNQLRPLIQDLDTLPLPDFEYENHYILSQKLYKCTKEKVMKELLGDRAIVHSIRGCHFHCSYCCNYVYLNLYKGQNMIRKKSVEYTIKELEYLKQKLEPKVINFDDDDFCSRTEQELKEFTQKYKERINIPFHCYGTARTVTLNKLKLLLDAGLIKKGYYGFCIGIQANEETCKKIYSRDIKDEDILKSAKIFKQLGMIPKYDLLVCNPYETEEQVKKTINLLLKLPTPFSLSPHILIFFHGSTLYERAKKDGFVHYADYDDWETTSKFLKEKNIDMYYHFLTYWMGGKSTRFRIGAIPRFLFKHLMKRKYNENKLEKLFKFTKWYFRLIDFIILFPSLIKGGNLKLVIFFYWKKLRGKM